MSNIQFYFNDVMYEGESESSNPYVMCCDVLKQNNISFTDDATFDVVYFSKHKTFVNLEEEKV